MHTLAVVLSLISCGEYTRPSYPLGLRNQRASDLMPVVSLGRNRMESKPNTKIPERTLKRWIYEGSYTSSKKTRIIAE